MSSNTLLTEQQITQIEAAISSGDSQIMYMAASIDNVRALCATVRALREKHTQLAEVSGEWAKLLDRIRLWSKCADGYPLDEHINNIATQLAQVTQERDDLLNRSHQTVLFDCGCMFKQEGLDAEPMLIVHCPPKEQP